MIVAEKINLERFTCSVPVSTVSYGKISIYKMTTDNKVNYELFKFEI